MFNHYPYEMLDDLQRAALYIIAEESRNCEFIEGERCITVRQP